MGIFIRLVTFLFLFSLIGCKKNTGSASQVSSSELMPLKIGNYWYYSNTAYKEDGSVIATGPDTIFCQTSYVLNGITYYGQIYPGHDSAFYANIDENTVTFNTRLLFKRVSTDGQIIYSGPVADSNCNGTQNLVGYNHITQKVGYDCISNDLNTYDCSNKLIERFTTYFKSGVGLVGTELYYMKADGTGPYLSWSRYLTGYHIN